MTKSKKEEQEELARLKKEEQEAIEGDVNKVFQEIESSGKSVFEWFASLGDLRKQEILAVLYKDVEFRSSIEKQNVHYQAHSSKESLCYYEDTSKIASLLPTEEGKAHAATSTINLYNFDAYQPLEDTEEITIEKEGEKYYLIQDGARTEVVVNEDGNMLEKVVSFESELEKRFIKYRQENNLDAAIERKDFALINRIIKNGIEIRDDQLIRMMRLSKVEGKGQQQRTPTFLHKLLDPTTGIANSKHVTPLIKKAKDLLGNFEFLELCKLSDGVNSASALFGNKELRELLPNNTVKFTAVDTHQTSVHASVDISAVKLYEEFQKRYSTVATPSTSKEKGAVSIRRSEEFNHFIQLQVESLGKEISAYLADDAKVKKIAKDHNKSEEHVRLELEAAKRLIYDACSVEGIMKPKAGFRTVFEVKFNEPLTNGLTLKEMIAIVYDSVKNNQDLETGVTAEDGFAKLITHLFEARREYNQNKYDNDVDLNKCSGGCVNHLVDSLSGIHKNVSVVYITDDDIRREAAEIVNKKLLDYLEEKQGAEKERFRDNLIKYAFNIGLNEILDVDDMISLKRDVKTEIESKHKDHFKDNAYSDKAVGAISGAVADNNIMLELGEIKYSLLPDSQIVKSMMSNSLPLYTKTQNGYELTLSVIKRKDLDYYEKLLRVILDVEPHQDATVAYSVLNRYQVDSADITEKLLSKLTQLKKSDDSPEKLKNITDILDYFLSCQDRGSLEKAKNIDASNFRIFLERTLQECNVTIENFKLLEILEPKILENYQEGIVRVLFGSIAKGYKSLLEHLLERSPNLVNHQNNKGSTLLHYAVSEGHTDIAKVLIEKMRSEDLALQDKYGNTALQIAFKKGNKEIEEALIEKMHSEDFALQDIHDGRIALHWALVKRHKDEALALIGRMRPKDLALQDTDRKTALHFAAYQGDTDVVKVLLDKMDSKDCALKDTINISRQSRNSEMEKLILDKMCKLPELHQAVMDNNSDEVFKLIRDISQEKLNAISNMGNTALHIAASKGHDDIVRILLKAGIDSDIQNSDGKTALDVAKGESRNVFFTYNFFANLHDPEKIMDKMIETKRNKTQASFIKRIMSSVSTEPTFDYEAAKDILEQKFPRNLMVDAILSQIPRTSSKQRYK